MSWFTNVRYGRMRMVARFKTEREDLRVRDRCIVRTDRGKEVGEVLSPLQPVPEALPPEALWDVVRRAGPEDLVNFDRLEKENVPRAVQACKAAIKKLNLPMKLTDVDYLLGGERIIFYFTSATRVDFRELVRELAHEFRTRIELKQVGARDEARLVGDCGHCGLDLCCRGHLKELGGITMDMAKVQKHTADPSKITGRCGKLLCCLRYEYTTYTESREVLPARGARLRTKKGEGVVVDQNMLLREVTIQNAAGDRVVVKLDEVEGAPAPVAGCSGCDTPAVAAPAPPAPAPAPEPAPDTQVRRQIEQETKVATRVVADSTVWLYAAAVSEVAPGACKVADLGGPKVAVFNVDGVFHVISNECGHQGGPLGEGKLEGFAVSCPLHQWRFDVTTGHCLSVSGSHVRKYESARIGDDLYVKV
jgi:cell fate regulator YaaT (PSP1 superfamily)/nitrite reductase/ring-hydroxylating ferredoxin subunit